MPFFYSQYLKDDKKAWAAREVSHVSHIDTPTKESTKSSSSSDNNDTTTTKQPSKKIQTARSTIRQLPLPSLRPLPPSLAQQRRLLPQIRQQVA
mmetsp:Transcript_20362/g.31873  ORF Transcript_20362/g.31873 Transcript_20362/m.31873 type:complete len:94 (-) Transcript_20362:875-1156(-)